MKALRSASPRALSVRAALSRSLKPLLAGTGAAATLALAASLLGAAPVPGQGGLGRALSLAAFRAAPPAAALKGVTHAGRGADGRYIYERPSLTGRSTQGTPTGQRLLPGALLRPRAAVGTPLLNEAVQTFDVFNPPPGFAPTQGQTQGPTLPPTNQTPVWTADETMMVFSSNRTATGGVQTDGRFHLWAISINGGTPVQLTSSTGMGTGGGGEFFPALSGGNNQKIAFTSDAQTPGTQNLYVIDFALASVNLMDTATVSSVTNRTDAFAVGAGGTGFTQVKRPAFAAARPDEVIFSALTIGGSNAAYQNHYHLYYLFTGTGGSDPAAASLPAKITDGPADDTDPAYSPDGQFIAFASNAPSIAPAGPQAGGRLDQSLTLTASPGANTNRNIFLLGGGGRSNGFGTTTLDGAPLTATGADNYGPAWSSLNRNAYLNPAPGAEYLAFSRGASPAAAHDIYYLQVLHNVDAGGESARSNEAATTPVLPNTPVYRVNAGGPTVTGTAGTFTSDTATAGVTVTGGTAEATNPPPVTNTVNDTTAPPAIYNTDRNGTFNYTFSGLTPEVPYQVVLHLSDPKNTTAGKRIFNVTANGFPALDNIDIVQSAQLTPGRVDGLVTDAVTGQPLPGATLTVTDAAGTLVKTVPSPLTSAATTTPDPQGGTPINYAASVAQGAYTLTASATGYPSKSRTLNINSGALLRADFPLTQATGTVTGRVVGTGGAGLAAVPLTVIEAGADGQPGANVPGTFATSGTGNFSLTLPVGTYYLTAEPPATSGFQVQTQVVTIAANTPAAQNFILQSGAGVGTVGGLVTNSASVQPLGGVLVAVIGSNGKITALTRTTAATTTPGPPSGDGKTVNYSLVVPIGDGSVQFVSPGYTPQTLAVTVVNTPGVGTTVPNAFVRKDAPLVSLTPVVGQNTAIVLKFTATPSGFSQTDGTTGIITTAGTLRIAFAPVPNGGDPPIVQGIEILAGPSANLSSGFGANNQTTNGFFNTPSGTAPLLNQAFGGVDTAGTGQVSLRFAPSLGTPSFYNIYRSAQGSGQEGNTPYKTGLTDTSFIDTGLQLGVEYFYQITAVYNEALTPEGAQPGGDPDNLVVKLNTDDNAVATLGGQYEDAYPTWSPGLSVFSIAYSSNRSVTYNSPTTNQPSETAISVPRSGALGSGGTVGAAYDGLLESQVLNLDPPTLVPYSGSEIVHIADQNGVQSRAGLTGGRPMSITVRLSSREAGVDDSNVYVQVKDPDSKYQDAQKLEHKVFARDAAYRTQINNPNLNSPDSGSSALLHNGGGFTGYNFFNIDGNFFRPQRGAIGGLDTFNNGGESIAIGTIPIANQNSTNPVTTGDDGKVLVDGKGNPTPPPGYDPRFFVPTGPEYECQTVNPAYASSAGGSGTDTLPADYATPYYLAGVDDQRAFSGFPAAGAIQGLVYTIDATTGNFGSLGGASVVVTDYFTGAAVTTTPATLISAAPPAGQVDTGAPNVTASLLPGQYRVKTTLAGYATDIQTLTVTERGTVSLFIQLDPDPTGKVVNDSSQTLFPSAAGDIANGHLPRPVVNSTTNVVTTTASGIQITTPVFHPAEWLKLTRLPDSRQDGGGGILYSVTWTPPASGSDFYLDVIAYDKAAFPNFAGGTSSFSGERSNWRIYDNVWGFSTQRDIGSNDILFVSDYALGQKFAATTFGGQNSLVNLVPKFYGAESYLTDIDTSLLPNATYTWRVVAGRKFPIPEVLPTSALSLAGRNTANNYGNTNQLNALGVGSYADPNIDDGSPVDGVPAVRSQQYSIWRTLARGPVPTSVYQSYEPTFTDQPAVADNTVTPAVTFPAARIAAAPRCIVWSAPFAGDLLVGPGTITDPATQTNLRAYVAAGGRLFMTGQDIGSALTQNGTTGNTAGGFLPDVLGAKLVTPNKGTFTATGGTSVTDNRISNVAFFDGQNRMNFYRYEPNGTFLYHSPSEFPILVSNNIGGNTFTLPDDDKPFLTNWRTDGSLDQLGPYGTPFSATDLSALSSFGFGTVNSLGLGNSVVGQIDTIALAGKNGHVDFALTPFTNMLRDVNGVGDPDAATSPGGSGLIYYDNSGTGGNGAKVVYSSFGFEALSTEYYPQQVGNPVVRYFLPHNQRQNMMHNIVCYLRTGTIQGTIRSTSGNGSPGAGISGATVYLLSSSAAVIPGRGTFSATSDSAGNFRITGVEPGTYTVAAYKNGFIRAVSNTTNTFTIEGDSTQSASVTLAPAAPGKLSGTVKDASGNPVDGATVTFNPAGGGQAQIATTDGNGQYSLAAIPSGSYTGLASKLPGFGSSESQNVTVTASGQSTANFVLSAATATVTGRVITTAGAGIPNASVIFTAGSPAAVVKTVTTVADGTYTATVPAGAYTLTATATNFGNGTATVQAAGGDTTAAPDIILGPVANGTLGGLVLPTTGSTPLAGAVITATSVGVSKTATSVAVPVAAPDGGTINYGPLTLAAGTYTVTASRGGVTTSPLTVTVTTGTFTRQDFSGLTGLPAVHTFPAGLQFVSLPYDYASLGFDGVFGTLNTATQAGNRSHVALWDPVASSYSLDPAAPADIPRLGVGYWVFLKAATGVSQTGTTPTGNVSVALHPAWNQIGVPSIAGITVSTLKFVGGDGVTRSFADAAGPRFHLVSPTLYRYDGTAYQPVSSTDTLQPWTAYWIRVYADVTLLIPTGK